MGRKFKEASFRVKTSFKSNIIDGKTHVYITDDITVDNKDAEQRVKILCMIRDKTLGEVAEEFGCSQASLVSRFDVDKFTVEEYRKFAEIFNATMVIGFVYTRQRKTIRGNSFGEMIRAAMEFINTTDILLAEKLGTVAVNLRSRIRNGKFTRKEMDEIAAALGCDYENYFVLEDGTCI